MRLFLVPTNHSRDVLARPPPWGAPWHWCRRASRSIRCSAFEDSYFRNLQAVLLHRLLDSTHMVDNEEAADACVVAGQPMRTPPRYARCDNHDALCPGKPIIHIEESVDADYIGYRMCPRIWNETRCRQLGRKDRVLRVVGSPAGLLLRKSLRHCSAIDVPWLAHARVPEVYVTRQPRAPDTRIAYVAGYASGVHYVAERFGFNAWRSALRLACDNLRNRTACRYLQPNAAGAGFDRGKEWYAALSTYARATFCLQPPGDMVARAGIIDALSVGCIPVLFHRAQAQLWTGFWNASEAAVVFEWPSQLDGAARMTRDELSERAANALVALLSLSPSKVLSLQLAGRASLPSLLYARRAGQYDDAVARLMMLIPKALSPTVVPEVGPEVGPEMVAIPGGRSPTLSPVTRAGQRSRRVPSSASRSSSAETTSRRLDRLEGRAVASIASAGRSRERSLGHQHWRTVFFHEGNVSRMWLEATLPYLKKHVRREALLAAQQASKPAPPVASSQREWGHCAVVGSSGSLRIREQGALIDAADSVIRCNDAPTEGYE